MLGRKPFNQELNEEELSSLALLTEQLAVTLRNARLQQDRLAAERRALRQEKLSTLGLLASSIAHEIKNPLSSIRTISTVMAEDLGPDSPHAEDLRLIISEIDRLSVVIVISRQDAAAQADGVSAGGVGRGTSRRVRRAAQLDSNGCGAFDRTGYGAIPARAAGIFLFVSGGGGGRSGTTFAGYARRAFVRSEEFSAALGVAEPPRSVPR